MYVRSTFSIQKLKFGVLLNILNCISKLLRLLEKASFTFEILFNKTLSMAWTNGF